MTDERTAPDHRGKFNYFENGSIYWSPETSAHIVWGQIYETWAGSGFERGHYGYPITDEYDIEGGKAQNFQGGVIEWKQYGYPGDWEEDVTYSTSSKDFDASASGATTPPQVIPAYDQKTVLHSDSLAVVDEQTDSCAGAISGDTCIERLEMQTNEELDPPQQPLDKDAKPESPDVEISPNANGSPYWCTNVWKGGATFACRFEKVKYELKRADTNGRLRVVGTIEGEEIREVTPQWNAPSTGFFYRFDIRNVTGEGNSARIEASLFCENGSCDTPEGSRSIVAAPGNSLAGSWTSNLSPSPGAPQRRNVKIALTVSSPGAHANAAILGMTTIRCDADGGARAPKGCRVWGTVPVWDASGSGDSYTRHLKAAQSANLPGFVGGRSLIRETNPKEIAWNREYSCGHVTGPRPAGFDCDEYPYAATKHTRRASGMNIVTYSWCLINDTGIVVDPRSTNNIGSVCLIPSNENRRAGARLGWFFIKSRILDGDEFWTTTGG